MTRTVAMTGATGFIGRHASAALLAQGFDVRAIVRPGSKNAAPPGTSLVQAPLEPGPLREAFAGASVVLHLAGAVTAVNDRIFASVNADGSRAAAEAAAAVGAHLVHISSLAAAGAAPPSAPRDEDDPPAPRTPYGRSKLDAERIVAGTPALRWTILRPGVVYGPGDRAVLPFFQFASLGVLPLVGRADAAYTFVHVHDAVRAIVAAVEQQLHGEILFVGHPRPATARDVLEAARAAVRPSALVIRVPRLVTHAISLAGDVLTPIVRRPFPLNRSRYEELYAEGFVCRVDRLRERLGIAAEIDLANGFAQTAEWYRQEGWISNHR